MGQITEDFAHQMLRHTGHGQHPPLTVWEAEQLARAWLEREVLRHERDHARAQLDNAVKLLANIHNLLYPKPVTTPDGRTMVFRPENPHEFMQALSDRIRALPDEMAARGIGCCITKSSADLPPLSPSLQITRTRQGPLERPVRRDEGLTP